MVVSAPGRVNLIGEHTDYNDGFVFPMAIDRRVQIAAAPRTDGRIVAYSEEYDQQRTVVVDTVLPSRAHGWEAFVAGIAWAFRAGGHPPMGMNLVIGRGVPMGAGVSSSAALEVGLARAICALADVQWEPLAMARLAQRAENEYVGVRCGIMDHMASAGARAGHAMLLDCRSLERSHVAIPPDLGVVVMDTGVRRALSSSEYNARRSACEAAVAVIRQTAPGVLALRDVTPDVLRSAEPAMDATMLRRVRHVVEENQRPAAMAAAFLENELARAGQLMNESHASLRDLYDVSSPQLDIACDAARAHPACHGARMTGAGFGGCAVALVQADAVADFIRVTQPQYEARTYQKSEFYAVGADDGAAVLFQNR